MTCDRCRLCLETSVADVLNQHTAPATKPPLTCGNAGQGPVRFFRVVSIYSLAGSALHE